MTSHDAQLLLTLAAEEIEDEGTDDAAANDSQSSVPDEDTWHPRDRLNITSYNRCK